MAIIPSAYENEDTVEFVEGMALPDEMADCVYEAVALGRRMRQSTNGDQPFYLKDCPFAPGTELEWAWRKGFLNPNPIRHLRPRPDKVDWKHDGF